MKDGFTPVNGSIELPISAIRMGKRYRKDMGDIDILATSIRDIGLLHPIVVTPDNHLIAGQRRILACQQLGWETVPARVIDLDDLVRGEHAENVVRKDFTPSEAVAIGEALELLEREAARERQGTRTDLEPSAKLAEGTGETRDKVAEMVGMGHTSYAKAKEVVEAAEREPELFGDLVEEMDEMDGS